MSHILTPAQHLAESKFCRAEPRKYALPAAQFYAGLHARAQLGRAARRMMWSRFMGAHS
jgi:hypothetical protein